MVDDSSYLVHRMLDFLYLSDYQDLETEEEENEADWTKLPSVTMTGEAAAVGENTTTGEVIATGEDHAAGDAADGDAADGDAADGDADDGDGAGIFDSAGKWIHWKFLRPNAANTEFNTRRLILHVDMYTIADKYNIDGLRTLALRKYENALKEMWLEGHGHPFLRTIRQIYDVTTELNRKFRDVTIAHTESNRIYIAADKGVNAHFEEVCNKVPEYQKELLQMFMECICVICNKTANPGWGPPSCTARYRWEDGHPCCHKCSHECR